MYSNYTMNYLLTPEGLEDFRTLTNKQAQAVSWANATRSKVHELGFDVIQAAGAAQKLQDLIKEWKNYAEVLAEEVAEDQLSEAPFVAQRTLEDAFPDLEFDPPDDLEEFEEWLNDLPEDQWFELYDFNSGYGTTKGVDFTTQSGRRVARGWANTHSMDGEEGDFIEAY